MIKIVLIMALVGFIPLLQSLIVDKYFDKDALFIGFVMILVTLLTILLCD